MALALSRPSTSGNRPAYLDKLFSENIPPMPTSRTPSVRSPNSSISSGSSTFDLHQRNPSALSPAFEEDSQDDKRSLKSVRSLRSLKFHLSPRLNIRNALNRRTYPQVQETVEFNSAKWQQTIDHTARRKPSLPKLQTSSSPPSSRKRSQPSTSKPLPATPAPVAEELQCQPCYYFAARNCSGYVMGGSHGDACESCAVRILCYLF